MALLTLPSTGNPLLLLCNWGIRVLLGTCGFLCLFLMPAKDFQLLGRLLPYGGFLLASRLKDGVDELGFVVVKGAELVLELDGFLKCFLLRGWSTPSLTCEQTYNHEGARGAIHLCLPATPRRETCRPAAGPPPLSSAG